MFRRKARIRFSCSTAVSTCVSYILHLPSYISLQTSYIKTSLPSSRYRPQRPMYRAFVGREGCRFTLTLPSLFWPLPSLITHHLSLITYSEGDGRENKYPSRGFSPFCIRVCEGWREGVRVILKILFFTPHSHRATRSQPEGTKPVARKLQPHCPKALDSQSEGFGRSVRRHGLYYLPVCDRSLFLLSSSEDSNLIAPFSLSACVSFLHLLFYSW